MTGKRNILLLMILLLVFSSIFFIAYAGLKHEEALFGIGIPAMFENWLIMSLCIASIIKIVWEIRKE